MRPSRQLAVSALITVVTSVGASVLFTASVAAATAPAAFGYGTPTFTDSAAPSSFSGAEFAGEPSVGVNWKSGAAMYMGGTSTARITFNNNVTPPAVTWTDVS